MIDGSGGGPQKKKINQGRLRELLDMLEDEYAIVVIDDMGGDLRILDTEMKLLRGRFPGLLAEIEILVGSSFRRAEPDDLGDVGRRDLDWVLSVPVYSCGDTYGQVHEEGSEDDPEDDPYSWWLG